MLNTLSLFSDLSEKELATLSQIMKEVPFRRGAVIFDQGDVSRDFFVIKSGQVEIFVKNVFHEKKSSTF